jgi:hypothetical protein
MQLVFIHGPAACGKLTVATELAALSGLRLFHNHLTVDLVASLFEFGSEPFVRLRESIWLDSFREAAKETQSLIFTFHPEASVRGDFPERVVSEIRSPKGEVLFVQLVCPESEIEKRIQNDSRSKYGKLRSLSAYRELRDAGAFEFPPLPEPVLQIDTGATSPGEAARQIASHLHGAA